MLHEYHLIYSVRYYPHLHVTTVGLGTYYLRVRGHYCVYIYTYIWYWTLAFMVMWFKTSTIISYCHVHVIKYCLQCVGTVNLLSDLSRYNSTELYKSFHFNIDIIVYHMPITTALINCIRLFTVCANFLAVVFQAWLVIIRPFVYFFINYNYCL
jgi:hypothetical protein